MFPLFNPHPLHSTTEIRGHPLFRGAISRWVWRVYTHRATKPGRWFLGLTFAFALYGATSLDLQVFVPFTYAFGIWLMALLFAVFRPPRVVVSAAHPPRVQAGQILPIVLEVRAEKYASFDAVLLPRRLPPALDAMPLDGIPLGTLKPGEAYEARLELLCTRRGRYLLRGFRVESAFPFGLLRAYSTISREREVLATPQFTPLQDMTLPAGRSDQPGGSALSTLRGESLEFIGDREFRDGDSIRDIDWRATARLDRLVVREFREEYFHRIALVLDTQGKDDGATNTPFECAVSLCAAASCYLAGRGYGMDLFAAGPVIYDFGGGQSLAYEEQMLDILSVAALDPRAALKTTPEMLESIAQVSAVVCFFLGWDEARRAFAESLRDAGAALRVFVVQDAPPAVDMQADTERFGDIRFVTPAEVEDGLDFL